MKGMSQDFWKRSLKTDGGQRNVAVVLRATSHTSRMEPVAMWQNGFSRQWPTEILKISTLRHRPIYSKALNVPVDDFLFLLDRIERRSVRSADSERG
jgi:hypothetical protein